ncbi:hypothetical protein HYH03_007521 [Edaphochlamys debaryana]|uniref:Uncharacterized protein n=1 Tax=Edaphochlamys debaryana TaxID=47281 RepID=A0A836C0H3_9CHLO|nr:hypothetical protein HYH03_007521 [Edaphochlamys debaryana]|eukprot:KAG2494469.1 hypothetical protein HYH03_007521 [Edaphochlamys debaryana]
MQREEVAVRVGSFTVRLLQRPPGVAPSPDRHDPTPCDPTTSTPAVTSAPDASPSPAPLAPADCLLGWELWPAATLLASFLASPAGAALIPPGARVLELGAGLGLPGIVAALAAAPAEVVLSDLPQALTLAQANAEANRVADRCRAEPLDWRDLAAAAGAAHPGSGSPAPVAEVVEAEAGAAGPGAEGRASQHGDAAGPTCPRGGARHVGAYDVVLAADVVYVSSLAPLLADVAAAVCRPGGRVVVGHTVRKSVWLDRATGEVRRDDRDEPWDAFLAQMTQTHGFSARTVATGADLGAAAAAGEHGEEDTGREVVSTQAADCFVSVFKRGG